MDELSTILIVDEDPFIRDVLVQKLSALGYRAVEARNGRDALDKVAREPPDLILLDVMMPVMDGFQACGRLKDDEDTRLIPVIIMTALHAVEDRIRGAEVGADDFLNKPVDDRELDEYFLGEFARTEGQKGGEFYTPASIGRILDPACGSGGMFVQRRMPAPPSRSSGRN
jgi:CheY-like chemotaxis protein